MSATEKERLIPASEWMKIMLPLLDEGHSLEIQPEGVSMIPFLTGGRDYAVLSTVSGKRLRRGDIALYKRGDGTFVLHRIYQVKNGFYYMLGDSHIWTEGPVKPEDIFAIATEIVRKGRRISCRSRSYRFCSWFWLILLPFRPFIFNCRRLKDKVFHHRKKNKV